MVWTDSHTVGHLLPVAETLLCTGVAWDISSLICLSLSNLSIVLDSLSTGKVLVGREENYDLHIAEVK